MAFDVLDQNITQLFKNDDTFYIPRYQRNYVWKELNWSQLIKDIRYCAEVTPEWSHFIGSMVFERKQKNGGRVDIIDGQQRILTLQIVIFAMIYSYRCKKNESIENRVIEGCDYNISYLKDLITNRTLGKSVSVKLENGYNEFLELNQVMMDLDEESMRKLDNLILDKKKEKSIILQAFKFFVNDFIKLEFDDLVVLTSQFLETRVVAISSLQEEEVYNIFEILNARGVKLKQIELLKNYLFKYLKPKDLLDTYKTKWSELEQILEDIDLDDFYLHVFRCWHYKNKLSKEQLFEVTKEQLRKGKSDELPGFFDYFIKCSGHYRAICDAIGNSVEAETYEYFKLKKNKQVRSVLLALKIKKEDDILSENAYEELLLKIRNFFVIFNLDNGASNKIDNDIYMLSNEINNLDDQYLIKYAVLRFLVKFSTYYKKENVLEDGLKNIIYSNKSARKNISSKLLVYFFKPLLLECEENRYVQYDFSKFNVEHILNDNAKEAFTYSLGNLILCPEEINNQMRNKEYHLKRNYLLNSGIPYLKKFAEEYETFDNKSLEIRTQDIVQKLKETFVISYEVIEQQRMDLEIYSELKKQLVIAFGKNSVYVSQLQKKGREAFIQYIYRNGELPKEEIDIIKEWVEKRAS